MIEEQALITSTSEGFATLEIVRHKPCGLCGQTRGCGNSIWGKLFAHQRSNEFVARNPIQANTGDFVIVGIQEKTLLRSAFLLYFIPLLSMFLTASIAQRLLPHESHLITLSGAVIGLLLGFIISKHYVASKKYSAQNEPIILRRGQENEIFFECHRGQ